MVFKRDFLGYYIQDKRGYIHTLLRGILWFHGYLEDSRFSGVSSVCLRIAGSLELEAFA
jgi:hypothetical protein